MNHTEEYLMEALKASLYGKHVGWKEADINAPLFFQRAAIHHILPLVLEACSECSIIQNADSYREYSDLAVKQVAEQTVRSEDFLVLMNFLSDRNLHPIVIKGTSLRSLYPFPYHRFSADEDLLIKPEEFEQYHRALLEWGMEPVSPGGESRKEYEVSYRGGVNGLYIEVHSYLFPPDSKAYGMLNRCFRETRDKAIQFQAYRPSDIGKEDPITIRTLDHTDHLLYLICHIFKHFLHSGFGLRQVCDIVLFADKYYSLIHWDYIWKTCAELHMEDFVKTIFSIADTYLLASDSPVKSSRTLWGYDRVNARPLLEDILDSGIYGSSSYTRLHSGTISLKYYQDHMMQQKPGKWKSLFSTVFLPVSSLKGRYPYLEKVAFLLPVAWLQRAVRYLKELHSTDSGDSSIGDAIRLADKRIQLMKDYRMLRHGDPNKQQGK